MTGDKTLSLLTAKDAAELEILRAEVSAANARAAEAESTRDDILAMAGHEMRTPLTALLLHLQALERLGSIQPGRSFSAPELAERMHGPINQVRKLADLLDRLLDISRIRTASMSLQLEAVDISLLLGATVNRFDAAAQASGTVIKFSAPENVIAYVDSVRIEQVLSNLVSNALKYGEGSEVSLRLRHDEQRVFIEVEDHGRGIAPEDQIRVFQRFERASSNHRGKSLGLGLFITKEIVESHGGEITLTSEPGKGCIFTVSIPRHKLF